MIMMRYICNYIALSVLIILTGDLGAQEFKGGVVKYQNINRYNWESTFGKFDDPQSNAWVASLPKESESATILYLKGKLALYEDDPAEKKAISEKLQVAIMKANYFKSPNPELKRVYYHFGKNEITRQMEFMTRNFLVTDQMDRLSWKMTNKRIKIQDYTCLSAEIKKGDQNITAWFTAEIPVSAGPDEFYGLPGLILAIEVDGETAFLATSIDLTPPDSDLLSKPDDGKNVTPKKFDQIVEEKIQEHNDLKKSEYQEGKMYFKK